MRRVVLLALGLALVAGLVAAVVGVLRPNGGPVYTVAQVQAGLQRDRAAWVGRTVRVRGWINGGGGDQCFGPPTATCVGRWITLTVDGRWGGTQLNVVLPDGLREDSLWPRPGGIVVYLWRLPLVGHAIREQSLSSTLRVRLLAASPACAHAPGPCAAGVLVRGQP